MKNLLLAALLLAAGTAVCAQTPDGEAPANEGVCDDLMWGTPGLYGLCVAFCEAQDCQPDFSAPDPFENCNPSNPKLLEIYNRKKQASDPDMPCIAVAPSCPCWTLEELDGLRHPAADDIFNWCIADYNLPNGNFVNRDYWDIRREECYAFAGSRCVNLYTVKQINPAIQYHCYLLDVCPDNPAECLHVWRHQYTSEEEFLLCEAQLNQAGADRGFECFQ